MNKLKKLKILVSCIMSVVLTVPSTAHAACSRNTDLSSDNSTTVASSSGGGGGTNKMSYLNDDGYKMTTFILATTSLDYINDLPSDIKKF